MPRSFPQKFDLAELKGPKAARLIGESREPRSAVFQELVGDAIRRSGNTSVTVLPLDSPDGGIDVYVESAGGTCPWLNDLPTPVIIECKSISEDKSGVSGRVKSAWERTLERTKTKSARGWVGIDEPWLSAKSYVFAVSCVFSAVEHKIKVRDRIKRDLESLSNPPAPERVEVIDWPIIRSLLERDQRVADQWLGSSVPGLLSHHELLGSLRLLGRSSASGLPPFKAMVLPEYLEFFAPPSTDRLSPVSLFAEVSATANDAGLLLTGPGGVGKSRTLIEVAHVATREGWRVLHVLPNDPPVENDVLFAEVVRSTEPVLVIVDYIEQSALNFGGIRLQLFPEMTQLGKRVAFLASARPGYRFRSQEWRPLFVELPFQPDPARNREICSVIFDSAAPTAVKAVGREKLLSVASSRPVMALLIGREIERQMREETSDDWMILRDAELTDWLEKRLGADGLVQRQEHAPFAETQDPSSRLLAAAAALASLPQSEPEVVHAAEAVLRGCAPQQSEEWVSVSAREIVSILRTLGWIELDGGQLFAAHDVVADEVFQSVIRSTYSHEVRGDLLSKVLIAATVSARSFGRFGRALSRLLKQSHEETTFDQSLRTAANEWLMRSAVSLSDRLLAAEPEEAAYALGAVVSENPWAERIPQAWETLVEPWLLANGRTFAARHLLYRALKRLPREQAQKLEAIAVAWLEEFHDTDSAAWVVSPLLSRPRLASDATTSIASRWAMEWIEKHVRPEGCSVASAYVIDALLMRGGKSVDTPVAKAIIWLERYGGRPESNLLLQRLLSVRLSQKQLAKVLSFTNQWLGTYGLRWNAGPTLDAAISRRHVPENMLDSFVGQALEWAQQWCTTADVSDLLQSLARLRDVHGLADRVCLLAKQWIDVHVERFEVRAVVRLLLQSLLLDMRDSPEAQEIYRTIESGEKTLSEATDCALKTIGIDPARLTPPRWRYALGVVISTVIRWSKTRTLASMEAGIAWVAEDPGAINADFVITAVLEYLPVGHPAVPQLVAAARHWLATWADTGVGATSLYVIGSVLGRREDLAAEEITDLVDLAVGSVAKNVTAAKVSLIRELLNRTRGTDALDEAVVTAALWLTHHLRDAESWEIVKRLLKNLRAGISAVSRQKVLKACSDWVFAYDAPPYPKYYAQFCQELRPFLDRNAPIADVAEPSDVVPLWQRLRPLLRAYRDGESASLAREPLDEGLTIIENMPAEDEMFEAFLPYALPTAHIIGDEELIARTTTLVARGLDAVIDPMRRWRFAARCRKTINSRLWVGISSPLHYLNALNIPYLDSETMPEPIVEATPVAPLAATTLDGQIVEMARRGFADLRVFAIELSMRETLPNKELATAILAVDGRIKAQRIGSRIVDVIREAGFVTPIHYARSFVAPLNAATAWDVLLARTGRMRDRYEEMLILVNEEGERLSNTDTRGQPPATGVSLADTLGALEGDPDALLDKRVRSVAPRLWLFAEIVGDKILTDRAHRFADHVAAYVRRIPAVQDQFAHSITSLRRHPSWDVYSSPELQAMVDEATGMASPASTLPILTVIPFRLCYAAAARMSDVEELVNCAGWGHAGIQPLHFLIELTAACGLFEKFRETLAQILYTVAEREYPGESERAVAGATYLRWCELSGRDLIGGEPASFVAANAGA
jgi:hypothetical protein